jgi:hypothetical protein
MSQDYRCNKCGAMDCRLWLDSKSPLTADAPLLCMECAEGAQRRTQPPGWRSARKKKGEVTIGIYKPAIPLSEGGYRDPDHISRTERAWWLGLNKTAPDPFAHLDTRTATYE